MNGEWRPGVCVSSAYTKADERRQLAQDHTAAHVPHPVGDPLVVLGQRAEQTAQHRWAAGRRCLVHGYRIVVPARDLDHLLTREGVSRPGAGRGRS